MLLLATMFVSPRRVIRPALMVDGPTVTAPSPTSASTGQAERRTGRMARGDPADSHAPAGGWWIAACPGRPVADALRRAGWFNPVSYTHLTLPTKRLV